MYGSTLANSYYDNEKHQILNNIDRNVQRGFIKQAIEKLIMTKEWINEDSMRYDTIDTRKRGFITLN